jgi:S-adenosylmethionine uptake transporter
LWFYSIGELPLGTAMTLNFSSPLFSTAFVAGAALVSGRRMPWLLAACVGVEFVGVVLILRPSFGGGTEVPALLGLLSGFISGVAYWHVRELGRLGEPEWRTVFYFSLCGCALGLVTTLPAGFTRPTSVDDVLVLLAVGVCATLAQLTMTRAYRKGRTMLSANLQFSAIVFAALLGIALFGDTVAPGGWLGIAIIITSCVAAATLATRKRPAPVIEPSIATADK